MPTRGSVRERIIRILLNHPDGSLTRYRIAKLSECSWQWVREFLRKLEDQGFARRTRITDYSGLVQYWRTIRKSRPYRDYMLPDPMQFLRVANHIHALTTYQAESLLQHYLFPSRTDIYVLAEDLQKWHEGILRAGGLVGSGSFRLLLSDKHVFYGAIEIGGHRIVSRPQLILDLLTEGGPCIEAAELILRKVAQGALRTV